MNAVIDEVHENTTEPMPIIDKGILFGREPVHEKGKRMSKAELHTFVRWMIKHYNSEDREQFSALSSRKIANLYFQECGKYISTTTVYANRNRWYTRNGKIIKV